MPNPSTPRLASLVPALALALALPLAGCSGGGAGPRLVVGDGPPADEWGLIGADGTAGTDGGNEPARPAAQPPRRPDGDGGRDGGDREDEDDRSGSDAGNDGDESEGEAAGRAGPLLALAAGDAPGTFVVTGHAAGADWGDVAVAADAGSWTLLVEGGTPGQYDFGDGVLASPDPGPVRDGDRLRFCDRSTVDGVTGTYVQVEDVPGSDVLMRERIQGSPC